MCDEQLKKCQQKLSRFRFSGMKKFLGSMAKKTTDAAKSLAAEASKKKAGNNNSFITMP